MRNLLRTVTFHPSPLYFFIRLPAFLYLYSISTSISFMSSYSLFLLTQVLPLCQICYLSRISLITFECLEYPANT